MISSDTVINQTIKIALVSGIENFYKFKSQKNGFPIVASSTLLLGAAFSYFTLTQGEGGRTDVVILSSIFGAVGVGFTIGSIYNIVKFKKCKRELRKQLALI